MWLCDVHGKTGTRQSLLLTVTLRRPPLPATADVFLVVVFLVNTSFALASQPAGTSSAIATQPTTNLGAAFMQPAGLQVRSPGTLSVLRESLWYPCVKHRRWRSVALSGLRETSDLAVIENRMVQQVRGPATMLPIEPRALRGLARVSQLFDMGVMHTKRF